MPTRLLDEAFAAAAQRPPAEQDAIASLILAELEDELRWQHAFDNSASELTELGRRALAARNAGQTRQFSSVDELPGH